MKNSTTLLLLVLTLGLGAWLLLREGRTVSDLGGHFLFDLSGHLTKTEEIKVDVAAEDIAGIDLKSSAAEISLRKRPDGGWDLVQGIKDRADAAVVKELIDYCTRARILDTIAADEVDGGKVSPASLGLDDTGAWRISWLKADGSVLASIVAGKTAPLDNAGYVRMSGESRRPDVYLVNPDLRPLLARPLDAFRDPRVARYKSTEVSRFVVRKGEGEVEFSRTFLKKATDAPAPQHAADPNGGDKSAEEPEPETTPWVISRPLPNAPADQAAVKDFVAMICGAKMKAWSTWPETATTAAADKPVVEVTLYPDGENARGATLAFFPDPESPDKTALCRDVQRKAEFKVDRQIMDDLCLAESPEIFRSRKLAAVEPGIISTVQVMTQSGDSVLVVRVGNRWHWRPAQGGEWEPAAPERLEKLIALINETEIIDFTSDSLSDPAAYGLDKPAMSITMAAGAHLALEQLTPMTPRNSQTLRIGILPDGRIFANFTGDPFVYRIGPELPSGIPQKCIKWRSLSLPGFSFLQFRGMRITEGTQPPLNSSFDMATAKWNADRAGVDVTAQFNKGAAEALVQKLGALTAAQWLESNQEAQKALETPAVTVQLQYEAVEENPPRLHVEQITLELAPMGTSANAPFCFGRISGRVDPFLIDRAILDQILAGLLIK